MNSALPIPVIYGLGSQDPASGADCVHAKAVDFPAAAVPNGHGLVSVHWLKRQLDGAGSSHPHPDQNERLTVLEAHWGQSAHAAAYREGHVPGALHLDTDELETPGPQWLLRGDEVLRRVIGRYGITPDTTVVVYGREQIAAARVWWVLRYAGVRDVRLLDGGFAAWARAGYPVERRRHVARPVEFAAPVVPALLASTEWVHDHLEDSGVWFADVRSRAEFEGQRSGYRHIDAAGRLPGALHVGDADDCARLYVRRDGRLRAPQDILALWRAQGLAPAADGEGFARTVVFYCGTGWRSSLALFYAWLLGFEAVRNYSDGWGGWSTVYTADSAARGATPGWRQQPSARPVERGAR